MPQELSGKVVFITGAAKNIGRATALAFAADGATVAINALTSKAEGEQLVKEIRDAGGQAGLFMGDIADGAVVKAMIADVVKQFGRLDVLVLNASWRKDTPFLELSFEQWRHAMGITLDGAFHCIQNCLPHMISAGGGSIVTMAGAKALSGAPGRVNGATARHGIIGMTRALAREFAPQNVRINCVSPGPIDTSRPDYRAGNATPASNIPLGRKGTPEEVAGTIHFLATRKAAFITGQIIHVNGGTYLGN